METMSTSIKNKRRKKHTKGTYDINCYNEILVFFICNIFCFIFLVGTRPSKHSEHPLGQYKIPHSNSIHGPYVSLPSSVIQFQ